jgi:hypothetical protein
MSLLHFKWEKSVEFVVVSDVALHERHYIVPHQTVGMLFRDQPYNLVGQFRQISGRYVSDNVE